MSLRPAATLTFELKSIGQVLGDPNKGYVVSTVTFPNQSNPGFGKAPVLHFPLPDALNPSGIIFEAQVEQIVAKEGGMAICSGRIYNLSKDIITAINPQGIVKLEAGYLDGVPSPKQVIFYGRLQSAYPYRSGGESVVEFSARAIPNALYDLRPNVSVPGDANIGTILEALCKATGLRIGVLDPALYSNPDLTSHPKWPHGSEMFRNYNSGSRSVGEEISGLIAAVSAMSGVRFGQVPNNNNPYVVDIIDLDKTGDLEVYKLLIDSPFVMSAGPSSGTADYGAVSTDATQANVLMQNIHSITAIGRFKVQTAFDPRVRAGLLIQAKGAFEGRVDYIVDQLTHVIGNDWTTTSEGFLRYGDFYEPIYPYGIQDAGVPDSTVGQ